MRRVITKNVLDMETLQWVKGSMESYPYNGQWEKCLSGLSDLFGGASSGDYALAKEEKQFMETLQNEQDTQFTNEQEAQNEIQNAWSPIIKGGAYQYGFSTAEDQNLISQIESGGATATENAVSAQQLREQQMSGGADVLPSGTQSAIEATQRELGAQATATNLLKEKELGYQTGRERFSEATGAEKDVASLANPTGYAGAAVEAGNAAEGAQQQVDKMNANSFTSKLLGGLTGGLGNLDTTGSSSGGEQAANFGLGMIAGL